jgi:maleate isomerase
MNEAARELEITRGDTRRWRSMPFELDRGCPSKAAIGLITLANDLTIEPELRTFLPREGVALYANRVSFPDATTVESLRSIERGITATAALINPGERLDVVIFGCTSGTMAIGEGVVAERIKAARPGVATTDPITAGLTGLRELGCRRIALLTPYSDEVNALVAGYIEAKGFEIGACGSFKRESAAEMCRIAPESIRRAGLDLGREAVDGLFVSCTGLRVSPIIDRLESALGKPVVASNQALAWHALRLAGDTDRIEGFGKLLTL